jgi:hypothetical protein
MCTQTWSKGTSQKGADEGEERRIVYDSIVQCSTGENLKEVAHTAQKGAKESRGEESRIL